MRFIKQNQLATSLTATLCKQIVEIDKTITVAPGTTNSFTALVGYDIYEIKTVTASTDTGDSVSVSMYEDSTFTKQIYQSLPQSLIQDIVVVPVKDKSGAQSAYISVNNSSPNTVVVTLVIKVVNL